jgi:thioredoxin-related protein
MKLLINRLPAIIGMFAVSMIASLPAQSADLIKPTLAEDGLYHHAWFKDSFLDLRDDLTEAAEAGKRLVIFFEQVGCIYCKKMQTEVLAQKPINDYVRENFDVVQLNLWGSREVTDFDGKAMTEKDLAKRWSVIFTPTIVFLPETAPGGDKTGGQLQLARMPGAFEGGTFKAMFEWVRQKGYDGEEHFQKYVIRKMNERRQAQ